MIAPLVLVVLVLLAGTSDRTGYPGAIALLLVSVVWLNVNGPVEGAVLVDLSPGHGITTADLVSVAGVGLAVWRLAQGLRQRGRQRSQQPPR